MTVDVKKVIQELIVPELKEIKLEQKNIQLQVDSLRNEMKAELGSLKNGIGSLRNEMRTEIRRLDEKLDIAIQIRERLAALESKVAASGR